MSTVQDIFRDVRDTLGDPSATRWDDATLLRAYNKGQYDIAKKTEIFKGAAGLVLNRGQYVYTLPDDFVLLKGVTFKQIPLPVYPAQQMDKIYGSDWRSHTTTGDILAIVMDRQDVREMRVYPRPFATDLVDDYDFTPDTFGVTVSLTDYVFDSSFGVVGSIYDADVTDINLTPFGIIVDALESNIIGVEYVRHPVPATSVLDTSELPAVFDQALVRYVSGTALRNDIDVQNRQMGNEELTLYTSELAEIHSVAVTSQTSPALTAQSEYRGMG